MSNIKPYERQPGESEKYYSYFCRYRDMGPGRTLRRVADELGKALITIDKLSQKYNWVKRSAAWADEVDKRKRAAIAKEVEEMAKRHSQQAMVFQRILMMPAEALLKKVKANNDSFDEMTVNTLFDKVLQSARMFSDVVDVERKSRGEPNDIAKQDITSNGESLVKVILPMIQHKKEDEPEAE